MLPGGVNSRNVMGQAATFFWSIRKKIEMVIRLTGFPLKTCGNDKQKQPFKIVILGLACPPSFWRDPGIQGISNLNTKDPLFYLISSVLNKDFQQKGRNIKGARQ